MPSYALIGEAYADVFGPALLRSGYRYLALPSYPVLSKPVSSHADMLLLSIGNTHFLPAHYAADPRVRTLLSRVSESQGPDAPSPPVFRSVRGPLSALYPEDVSLNALICDRFLFARLDALAPEVREFAIENGMTLLNVRQGYAGCSSIVLSPHAILTSDVGIQRAARAVGLETLLLPPGQIHLAGYRGNGGMPGGAAGADFKTHTLFLCGTPPTSVERTIRDFCACFSWQVRVLSESPWTDVGGIRFL